MVTVDHFNTISILRHFYVPATSTHKSHDIPFNRPTFRYKTPMRRGVKGNSSRMIDDWMKDVNELVLLSLQSVDTLDTGDDASTSASGAHVANGAVTRGLSIADEAHQPD